MKKKTYYHIILDQSGSMQDCITPTISGFNEQVQLVQSLQNRFPEQELYMGLTRFNNEVMHTAFAQSPFQIPNLTNNTYQPSGTTALYDAIGSVIHQLSTHLLQELKDANNTVVVVIITDGYENASTSFNHKMISSMIKELEAAGQWTFSYIGATLDAEQLAETLNIKHNNSMSFEKSSIRSTYSSLGESLANYVTNKQAGKNLSNFLKKGK